MREAGRTRLVAVAVAAAAIAAPAALAQSPPPVTAPVFEGFRAVLAQGEGQSVTAPEFAAYQASGEPPRRFVDQQPLYDGIMPRAATLTEGDLDVFYRRTDFGAMPGGVGSAHSPREGVTIYRDAAFGVAHIYAGERDDLMFGAGYATAEERLFLMDAIRRTAKGTLAGLTGPGAAEGDAEQLTDQDFSDEEMRAQFDALDDRFGDEGRRMQQDVLAYVDGINARIDEVNSDPSQMPVEYPALGARPERWDVSDTVAMAILLVTQFTVSNGGEERNAMLQHAFRERFGRRWRAVYDDFRMAEDPEAVTVARRPYRSDRPGRVRRGRNAIPDAGSIERRNTIVEGPGAAERARARAAMPGWVRSVAHLRRNLPHWASNAVLVSGRLSQSGRALAAMGPQVSYFSPQIFSEYELHGGGIDVAGVTFPGASPWPLIGHGIDFAWSGTSANGDNQDTFVEQLCEPDGSEPSRASTHYMYEGRCVPFVSRDQTVTTPTSPVDPAPPQRITYRTLRSVHGPVFAYATVGGRPVALTKAKGVNFNELDGALVFMQLAENQPTDARSFFRIMGRFPGTENWFYVDEREQGFLQSGRYPRHAPGSDVDLPFRGDGPGDWVGFDPATYSFRTISPSQRPRALDPPDGYVISWNNKEAPGWRKGPAEWSDGPVHRALILERRLRAELRRQGGKVDLAGLARTANLAATTDLIGQDVYPWLRRVIGQASGDEEQVLALIDAWHRSGSKRLDEDGDNLYEHGAAIAAMDAWWPRAVRAQFEPALGRPLFERVVDDVLGLGRLDWDWASHVQKDLRAVLGRRVRGRFSRAYCGGPARSPVRAARLRRVRRACRERLLTSLREAIADVRERMGADPAGWRVPATCPQTEPESCDQIVPAAAGAVETPPFPWQNRGTYHQVTEVRGHR